MYVCCVCCVFRVPNTVHKAGLLNKLKLNGIISSYGWFLAGSHLHWTPATTGCRLGAANTQSLLTVMITLPSLYPASAEVTRVSTMVTRSRCPGEAMHEPASKPLLTADAATGAAAGRVRTPAPAARPGLRRTGFVQRRDAAWAGPGCWAGLGKYGTQERWR